MEAGGGAFNLGVASSPQEGRRKKTRRAGKKRKDARHRKVAQKRGMGAAAGGEDQLTETRVPGTSRRARVEGGGAAAVWLRPITSRDC